MKPTTSEETNLLQQINQGLPESTWQEYRELITKLRAETLTSDEHVRLVALSDTIETAHVERLTQVAVLAQRRQVPLKTLMGQLGVKPRRV